MIRRDWPRGAETPERWLLIRQPDHAVLSHQLAEAWGGEAVEPLVCSPDEPGHPLAAVRRQVLAAIEHHDDGWIGWSDHPAIDPASGKPLAFTEMPTADAQRIWTDSITACRAIGPLAGWMVASHFTALQSRGDRDEPEWDEWLDKTNRLRADWLREWLAADEHHTQELANRCLAWLQVFDWISLWLCCRCPNQPRDLAIDPLEIGEDETGWPRITILHKAATDEGQEVRFAPWPFACAELHINVAARSIPVGSYQPGGIDRIADPTELAWQLVP